MTKNTFPVSGGAVPKIDRAGVMRQAWAIFGEAYKFPQIKFTDIGRNCFAWALKQAWAEAKQAAHLAAMSPTAKADRIAALVRSIELEQFNDHWPSARERIRACRTEINQLSA